MGERDDVATKRTACQAALTALREALHAVDSVPQALLSRINSPHRSGHAVKPSLPLMSVRPALCALVCCLSQALCNCADTCWCPAEL